MTRWLSALLIVALLLLDLAWNLNHLNIGLVDFYGLTLPALGLVQNGAWPATPYFPAGYPLLLIPFGYMGSTLVGGYVLSAIGAMLALWGVRRLALELGVSQEWTLAAVALAWAEPCFRVTAGSPTPDMLYTGLGVWFIWLTIKVWHGPPCDRPSALKFPPVLQMWALYAFVLLMLRYHAVVLVVPFFTALLLSQRFTRGAGIAVGIAALFVVALNWETKDSGTAAPLQMRVGLEASQPTHFESTEALFATYANFAEHARSSSVVADYGRSRIVLHALSEWVKYLRRPSVALALLLWLIALALRRLNRGFTPLGLWILCYTLALSAAYYTPRAALLPVVVAVALVFALLPRLVPRRSDLALGAACLLLLGAYWPAGKFARADLAQRRQFAALSTRTAQTIEEYGIDPASYMVDDMRVIRLPSLDNPWQLPFPYIGGQTWLDDPAIRSEQLPGYHRAKDADETDADQPAYLPAP